MIKRYLTALMPYGLVSLYRKLNEKKSKKLPREVQSILLKNEKLRDIHRGERCFIVGTGPSINTQDMSLLKNEIVFSMSRFFHHEQYLLIKPKYQVISGYCLHPDLFLDNSAYEGLKELDEISISEIIFHNYGDKNYIESNNFFHDKNIHFFKNGNDFNQMQKDGIDLTKTIYDFACISVLTIQIAIYMGFENIYLLGLDHDWILRMMDKSHVHFFSKETGVWGKLKQTQWNLEGNRTFGDYVNSHYELWQQYEKLKTYTESKNIHIFNTTNGGLLDVFPRVKYEELFK